MQEFRADKGSWTTPAFWQDALYIAGSGDHGSCDSLKSFDFAPSTNFNATASSSSSHCFGFPGGPPVISSAGNSNGIVWAIDAGRYGTAASPCGGPEVLYSYDATNLRNHLWDSAQAGTRDQAGAAVRFTVPTVANGKVYIGTRTEVESQQPTAKSRLRENPALLTSPSRVCTAGDLARRLGRISPDPSGSRRSRFANVGRGGASG
ncbi:MAG: hypothetical protein DMG97_15145 [Acidobacteria bacterium]|nr:MAG: hypothetical protein DMG97_15145 [Acidobacteriota bacterium]